ncbi:MAG: outer membrane beta-barrel protein, partial [Chitinivibrionales bacterium]|nr:outer membrane beta-barrel protein [Chitinivibrionales bacterium]
LDDQLRLTFPVVSDDPYVWFIAGATVTFGFGRYFAIQPELLYHRMGKEYALRQAANIFNLEIRSDYLTIPVLFKLNLPSNDKFRPNFFVGPHLSFTLNSEVDGLNEIPDTLDLGFLDRVGRDDDVDDETRNVDVGVTVGVGLDIKVGPGFVVVDARYMRGFIDVFDTDEVTNNAEEIKNQGFAIMAGYTYPF